MGSMTDDRQLAEALRQKDEKAFSIFVTRFQPMVARVIFKITGDMNDTNDLTQDVFLTVWEQVEDFRGEAALTTWVYQLATNKALNHLKWEKRRQFFSLSYWGSDTKNTSLPKSLNDAPGRLIREDDSNAITAALDQLPGQQKAAFVLSKSEGLSNPEIATILGLSVSAVESLNFRAKQNLTRLLKTYYQSKTT
ncbi:MAG: RNA polymerase sigma factor [Bacteroidales bacterium]|nr:RNA polymerase sigma factor [Bacteroidales bacterium]